MGKPTPNRYTAEDYAEAAAAIRGQAFGLGDRWYDVEVHLGHGRPRLLSVAGEVCMLPIKLAVPQAHAGPAASPPGSAGRATQARPLHRTGPRNPARERSDDVKTKAPPEHANGTNGKPPAPPPAGEWRLLPLARSPRAPPTRRALRRDELAGRRLGQGRVLEPVLVRPRFGGADRAAGRRAGVTVPAEAFELVAGERRYRAAKLAG
jgi:hypothetical protein